MSIPEQEKEEIARLYRQYGAALVLFASAISGDQLVSLWQVRLFLGTMAAGLLIFVTRIVAVHMLREERLQITAK